jgi:2-iminoacetate synthase
MEEIAHRLRDKFAAVSIEIQPMSTEDYHRLFLAGITAVAVYQETYNRDMYKKGELDSKKINEQISR